MRQGQLFTKTSREAPRDEQSVNARLLIRAGFVDKLMAGVYSYLPLGLLVLKKIENIIREEMNKIGGQEVLLPALHPKEAWQKTDRWKYPEMFKIKNRAGKDFGLGWTHEEIITPLVKKFVKSHKDLPIYVYQFQTKFRDELRAKSGLLRGVEFPMKDLYSFHKDEKDLDNYYEKVKKAYFIIFERCGIAKETFLTLASGGVFSKYSHEFQTVTPYGEDEIYFCPKCKIAVNKELIEHQCPECKSKNLEVKKAIEVGNIFKLQDRFSRPFNLTIKNEQGEEKTIVMGCYGIGLSRAMAAIVEVCHDGKGIIWPKEAAPFAVHLLKIQNRVPQRRDEGEEEDKVLFAYPKSKIQNEAEKLYQDLLKSGIEVLYDDRDRSPGEKFADADLIGIPLRIVISEGTLSKNCVEMKKRDEKAMKLIKLSQVGKYVK